MILEFPRAFSIDDTEHALPDVAAAMSALGDRAAPLQALLARQHAALAMLADGGGAEALLDRIDDALRLAYARLARRHGHLGRDLHAYHNEDHILDICGERIDRLRDAPGADALSLRDWCALMLFGAGHDLRQREAPQVAGGIGANERASIEEMQRILDACGFSRSVDDDLYAATELTIAGSTFDARPPPGGSRYNAADLVHSGGAFAAQLDKALDARAPAWRADRILAQAHRLALIAADLDTANVADPFAKFALSGENLCREREMLSGRSLHAGESALPVLNFLGDGQDRFFFDLHRFHSEFGRSAFDDAKQANAGRLRALSSQLRNRVARCGTPVDGAGVIALYRSALVEILEAGAPD